MTLRALALFAREDPSFDTDRTLARIRSLTEGARRWLKDQDDPEQIVEVLNWFFFDREGFASDLDLEDPDNLFPDRVLRRRRGYCIGLALIYLAVAEGLDLPIRGVNTSQHLFLRYDDGEARINIEMLAAGRNVPDEQYRERDRITRSSEESGVVLTGLDADRFLSQIVNNLGTVRTREGELSQA